MKKLKKQLFTTVRYMARNLKNSGGLFIVARVSFRGYFGNKKIIL